MRFLGALFGGVAGNAVFAVVQALILRLPSDQVIFGYAAGTLLFGAFGYWVAGRRVAPVPTEGRNVMSDIRGGSADLAAEGIETGPDADVLARIRAKGNVKIRGKNINTKG